MAILARHVSYPQKTAATGVPDFAIGTVAGSAGNLGQRVATSAIPGASILPKLARGAVTGASSGTVQQGLTTATAPETWKDGAVAGAGKVAKSTANGALIGATVGTATTALVEGGTRVVQAAQARLQSSTAKEINRVETLPGSKSPASASKRDPHRKPPGEDWYQATEGSDEKAWIKLKSGQDGKGTWIDGTHSVKFSRSSLLNSVCRFSDNKLFGQGVSVTKYGQTNAAEDFAETGVVVLKDLPRYKAMSVSDWAKEPFAETKLSYAQAIGLEVPSFQDVLAAMKQ